MKIRFAPLWVLLVGVSVSLWAADDKVSFQGQDEIVNVASATQDSASILPSDSDDNLTLQDGATDAHRRGWGRGGWGRGWGRGWGYGGYGFGGWGWPYYSAYGLGYGLGYYAYPYFGYGLYF